MSKTNNSKADMNAFQVMARTLASRIDRNKVDVVMHAGEFGKLVIKQVITGREHDFITIRAADDKIFVFHLDVISQFPLEILAKNSSKKASIGFKTDPSDDSTDV